MTLQLALFYAEPVTRVRECPNCHRTILAGRRMCDVCASEHRQDSRRNYRRGLSLFEDEYETGYDAAQERYEKADYALLEDEKKRFTWEDMICMRQEGDLPVDTQLVDLHTGNVTYLELLEDIDISDCEDDLQPGNYTLLGLI